MLKILVALATLTHLVGAEERLSVKVLTQKALADKAPFIRMDQEIKLDPVYAIPFQAQRARTRTAKDDGNMLTLRAERLTSSPSCAIPLRELPTLTGKHIDPISRAVQSNSFDKITHPADAPACRQH